MVGNCLFAGRQAVLLVFDVIVEVFDMFRFFLDLRLRLASSFLNFVLERLFLRVEAGGRGENRFRLPRRWLQHISDREDF